MCSTSPTLCSTSATLCSTSPTLCSTSPTLCSTSPTLCSTSRIQCCAIPSLHTFCATPPPRYRCVCFPAVPYLLGARRCVQTQGIHRRKWGGAGGRCDDTTVNQSAKYSCTCIPGPSRCLPQNIWKTQAAAAVITNTSRRAVLEIERTNQRFRPRGFFKFYFRPWAKRKLSWAHLEQDFSFNTGLSQLSLAYALLTVENYHPPPPKKKKRNRAQET